MLREVSCYTPAAFQQTAFCMPEITDHWQVLCVIPDMPHRMIVILTDAWPVVQ